MDDQHNSDLEQRLTQLEGIVAQLQQAIERLQQGQTSRAHLPESEASVPDAVVQSPSPRFTPETPKAPQTPERSEPVTVTKQPMAAEQDLSKSKVPRQQRISIDLKNEEFWLNRLGIGLLLLGVGFLFKYSVDQGWLTPAVRISFGFILGGVLLGLGLRLRRQRSALSQILIGGSIGTFYITIFAAYQLYQLWPYLISFLGMVAVTLLAFVMSLRERQAALSVVATLGGLGTPFVLYSGQGNVVALVGYTCLILGGASAIYARQGWRSLLWSTFVATWIIFGVAYDQLEGGANGSEQIALQLGVLFAGLAFAGLPVVKVVWQLRSPTRRSRSSPVSTAPRKTKRRYLWGYGSAQILGVLTPLLVISFSGSIWELEPRVLGWIAMVMAALYTYGGYGLRRKRALRPLGNSHWLSACLLLTFALPTQFSGNPLLLVLVLEALGVNWIAQRISARSLMIAAHLLTVALGIWLLERLGDHEALVPSLINPQALTDLVVMGVLGGIAWLQRNQSMARIYQILMIVALLMWFWRELVILPHGTSYVIVAWGVAALGLFLLARRLSNRLFLGMAYLLSSTVGVWLLQRLVTLSALAPVVSNVQGLGDLAVLALGSGMSMLIPVQSVARGYQLLLHLAVLIWFWRELSILPSGEGYVTLAWGIYAIALLTIGLRRDWQPLRWVALATLLVVVLKLFLYDLANLEALWRILLFLGFGGAFLGLSYFLKILWKPRSPSNPEK